MIAAIDGSAVVLLDPATGAVRSRIPLPAEVRRRWNWFSRLVPNGTELLVAQSGGGYQEVAVVDLKGQTRWSFRPDPSLPPIALLPADLDADGRPELYTASLGTIYRLDVEGVWSGGNRSRASSTRSTRRRRVAGSPASWRPSPLRDTSICSPRPACRAGDCRSTSGRHLEGRPLLQHPLGDFRFHEAQAVRLDDDPAAHLAVMAAGPREVGRSRLLVFSPAGTVVYDEILAGGGRLLIARDPGGRRETLLLAGDGLWRYRR